MPQAAAGLYTLLPRSRAAWRAMTPARRATWALFLGMGLLVLCTFDQYGISNDEEVQNIYGRLLVDFYASSFSDQAAFEYKNLYLYGGLFDLLAALLERVLPLDIWDLRHLLSALFGLAGIAAVFRLTRLLADEATALAAAVLLALAGGWWGAMFTHTKDVPFAACMAWALYYTTRVAPLLPAPPLRLVVKLGAAIGCAFGLRVGAVFAVFYLGMSVLAAVPWRAGARACMEYALAAGRALLPAAVTAAVLTAVFWPWAMLKPGHLPQALETFSHFTFSLKTVFNGRIMDIGAVPGRYLPGYLAVRLPELLLLGLACGLTLAVAKGLRALRDPRYTLDAPRLRALLPVILAFTVPVTCAWLMAPPLYNGIRHFLFVLPPAAVLSALGLRAAWQALPAGGPRTAWAAAAAALGLWHATTLSQLHPYEYVYYNQLFAGGVAHARGKWELDYWSDSLREASLMLRARVEGEVAAGSAPRAPYPVAVCAEAVQAGHYLGPLFRVTRDWLRADFFLTSTSMGCENALRGTVIGSVDRMGVPLAIILDRRQVAGADRIPR